MTVPLCLDLDLWSILTFHTHCQCCQLSIRMEVNRLKVSSKICGIQNGKNQPHWQLNYPKHHSAPQTVRFQWQLSSQVRVHVYYIPSKALYKTWTAKFQKSHTIRRGLICYNYQQRFSVRLALFMDFGKSYWLEKEVHANGRSRLSAQENQTF